MDVLAVAVAGRGLVDPHEPVFAADDEARAIWRKVTGFGDDRILRLGKADNFW